MFFFFMFYVILNDFLITFVIHNKDSEVKLISCILDFLLFWHYPFFAFECNIIFILVIEIVIECILISV